jgi:hypothetical protein
LGKSRLQREQPREIPAGGKLFRVGCNLWVRSRVAAVARERRVVARCQNQTSGTAPGEVSYARLKNRAALYLGTLNGPLRARAMGDGRSSSDGLTL